MESRTAATLARLDIIHGGGDAQKVQDRIYLDESSVAPAPSRDYFRLQVTSSTVRLTQWRVFHGPKSAPIQTSVSLKGWNREHLLVADVCRVFGTQTADYINRLSQGRIDWINLLPDAVLAKIFAYIGIKHLQKLAPVSKRFRTVCSSNELWERFFRTYRKEQRFDYDVGAHASHTSWKSLFFINRLQDNVR